MKPLCLPAPAKVNLFLHITGQREDGYHELQTLFQFLNLADELSLTLRDDGQILLENQLDQVAQEDNLIWQAAQLLKPFRKNSTQGVSLKVKKILPMGGGLGAGSSNAATTILGLNHLWELNLSLYQLAELGLQLGADVPVFVRGKTAWGEGIGEKLQPIKVARSDYLLIHPGCHCNTKAFFMHPRLPRATPKISIETALDQLGSNDFTELAKELYPPINACFDWLKKRGLQPWLTGTGACVFARLQSDGQGKQLLKELPASWGGKRTQAWVVSSNPRSPVHRLLEEDARSR